jgi:glycosyltransferase involved in cell wall biosynthesis
MKPTVSVVVPAFNAERFIERALESAIRQTVPPREVIVVNDGSTDTTAARARRLGTPVRVMDRENRGLSIARNTGILAAEGDLIAFLDADDSWQPTKLERQVELLERHPSTQACFTATEYVTSEGEHRGRSVGPDYPDLMEGLLLHSCVIGPPSAGLFRREVFEAIGLFDPRLSQCSDWDMWLRLAERAKVEFLPEVLVRYELHDSNMSRDVALLEEDTLRVLTKFFAVPRPRYAPLRRRAFSNHWLILAGSYYHARQHRRAWRCVVRSVLAHPPNALRLLLKAPRVLGVPPNTPVSTA